MGNYVEDRYLDDVKLRDFLKRKDDGQLATVQRQKRLEHCLKPAELDSHQSVIHYDAPLMLGSHGTRGFLAGLPFESLGNRGYTGGDYSTHVVTTPNAQPTVRSTFCLTRVSGPRCMPNPPPVMCFGDQVRIISNPEATAPGSPAEGQPMFLSSEPSSHLSSTRVTVGKQAVYLSARPSGESLWEIVHPDPLIRDEVTGTAVAGGEAFLIKHIRTGTLLAACEPSGILGGTMQTDFGREHEVFCHPFQNHHRHQLCVSELKGTRVPDQASKRVDLQNGQNLWVVFGRE